MTSPVESSQHVCPPQVAAPVTFTCDVTGDINPPEADYRISVDGFEVAGKTFTRVLTPGVHSVTCKAINNFFTSLKTEESTTYTVRGEIIFFNREKSHFFEMH